jgi:hypothetical protein
MQIVTCAIYVSQSPKNNTGQVHLSGTPLAYIKSEHQAFIPFGSGHDSLATKDRAIRHSASDCLLRNPETFGTCQTTYLLVGLPDAGVSGPLQV